MPELPEVETTVRELRKHIIGLTITAIWTDWPAIMRHGSLQRDRKRIIGKKILSVRRRAKYIVIDLAGEDSLFVHQKMSGHLLYGKYRHEKKAWVSAQPGVLRDDPKNQFIRLVFSLNNKYHLVLSDLRRFGKIILVHDKNIPALKELKALGPEPLEITLKQFQQLFTKKKGYIKPTLMDPTFIAGIGNIYADEILWDTGIHPRSRVEHLTSKYISAIYTSMRKILRKAIHYQGSSMDDYRLPNGSKGDFQNRQKAYQRTGTLCLRKDGGVITRIHTNGRSSHFCPKHQKLL